MTQHSIRYTNGEEDIVLTMPWGFHTGRIPPPVIEFFGYTTFVYAGDTTLAPACVHCGEPLGSLCLRCLERLKTED